MTDLTKDTPRVYACGVPEMAAGLPVKADTCIYEGMAVGEDSSNGTADVFADGDVFLGFAARRADNSGGSAGDVHVYLRAKGIVELTVTGGAQAALGETVYATDSNTFSTTDSGSDTAIGKIHQHILGTKVLVAFEGSPVRSL